MFSVTVISLIILNLVGGDLITKGNGSSGASVNLFTQVSTCLEHFKQNDPIGLPGARIPDPLPVPDVKHSLTMGTMIMKNVSVYGLSKFRLKHIHLDLIELKVFVKVQFDKLNVEGNYKFVSAFSKREGLFRVLLEKVFVTLDGSLEVNPQGKLHPHGIKMDIRSTNTKLEFQNSGWLAQGFMNLAPNLIFETIKPFILEEALKKIRSEVNAIIEGTSGGIKLPNSIKPFDVMIAETRKIIRSSNVDPYFINDYNHTSS